MIFVAFTFCYLLSLSHLIFFLCCLVDDSWFRLCGYILTFDFDTLFVFVWMLMMMCSHVDVRCCHRNRSVLVVQIWFECDRFRLKRMKLWWATVDRSTRWYGWIVANARGCWDIRVTVEYPNCQCGIDECAMTPMIDWVMIVTNTDDVSVELDDGKRILDVCVTMWLCWWCCIVYIWMLMWSCADGWCWFVILALADIRCWISTNSSKCRIDCWFHENF